MRRLAFLMLMMAGVPSAHAADLPDLTDLPILRGALREGSSTRVVRWRGYYVGGQNAYGAADTNFAGANDALIASALGPNNLLSDVVASISQAGGKVNSHQSAIGGFAGYNGQWDDVVLGLELNYMHGKFTGSSGYAPVPLTYVQPFSDGQYHTVGLSSSRSISITDIGTIRARAAYVAGNFLPYIFGGIALGRADISSNATVTDRSAGTFSGSATGPLITYSATDGTNGKMLYGYATGLGTEAMLFGNLFARAEWEYLRFVNAGADVNINTVRAGLGYRF